MYGIDDVVLIRTCYACPEQYDAYVNKELAGYLKLLHGRFTVEYPDVDGELLYTGYPGGGIFNDDERDEYLLVAKELIVEKVNNL